MIACRSLQFDKQYMLYSCYHPLYQRGHQWYFTDNHSEGPTFIADCKYGSVDMCFYKIQVSMNIILTKTHTKDENLLGDFRLYGNDCTLWILPGCILTQKFILNILAPLWPWKVGQAHTHLSAHPTTGDDI